MNDDLIARLRDNEIYQDLHGVAADAIAALVAENAKLRTDHASIVGAYDNKVAGALEAQAKRIAELDAALLELLSVAPAKAPAAGILVGIEARHRNAIDRARAVLAPKESSND